MGTTLVPLALCHLGNPQAASANPNIITVNNKNYTVGYGPNKQPWNTAQQDPRYENSPWWGDEWLAKDFRDSWSAQYGDTEIVNFAYKAGQTTVYGVCSSLDKSQCSSDGFAAFTSNSNVFPWAFGSPGPDPAPPTPTPTTAPINPAGNINGTNNNVSSNLSSGRLLPQFEGGTLTVDQDNQTYNQDFTLSSSTDNAINNKGFPVKFSGIFSDASGASGNITFRPNGNYIEISGRNTYTGITFIDGDSTLVSRYGAIPDSSDVYLLSPDSKLAILGGDETIASLRSTHGTATVNLEGNNLTLGSSSSFPAVFTGSIRDSSGQGNITKTGSNLQALTGRNTYTGATIIRGGRLAIIGSITSETTVETGGILQGTGTIYGDVINEGNVSPGNDDIGTLTVDGNYLQGVTASLNIDVNGSDSDLLKITGPNRVALLGGNLNISSYQGAPISANKIYTAIDVTGADSTGGEIGLTTSLNVIGSSGFTFTRETDPLFAQLDPNYYATCTSSDLNVQKNCTRLQFAWVKNDPTTSQPLNPNTTKLPGKETISNVKKTGGAITTASSGNPNSNTNTCTSNGGSASTCQQQNKPGTGASGNNNNTVATAKALDAGWASVSAAVTSGVTGGKAIGTTGYTTNQTSAALVTPDFANVIAALFAVPTRQQLNQALHSISAEPYASMQSVALEAMEQFRANTLALTSGTKAIPFIAEEEVCTVDGNVEPRADGAQQLQPDCEPRTVQRLTPWSLLIDGTNTQATLNGTNDLASLDYNIFSSSYGLQYDFNRNWSAGAAFGYGRANLYNYEYADVRIESSTYSGAAWGIYRPSESWKFTALAGYMNLQYESDRNINFGGLNRTANANWSGNGFTAALAAEYDWVLSSDKTSRSAVRIKPNTFFSYALHNQGAFSETGADSLNLALNSHTADSLIYGIGFQIETPIVTGKTSRLIPRLSLGYEYDFNGDSNEEHQLTASFAEVPALGSIDVLGQNRGANALDVGLSLEYETSETLSLYAGVGGAFWSNGNELSYGGGLKLRW
ncbi:autotransporter domain-containing protein [Synechococcus sp. CBW1107]|uniref:autotransporter family protein n=1 Tax=Synechococcus sp. CBW1107 TaxID=2789857 RepID=UPI002AD35EFE|nr:autotransporter domain-containing protein [Synechococcus sp. CBW1107]CAK6690012.1 hypothetical protein MNNICLKF_00735 [Synechococcus sp. CBW1107]